MIAFGGDRRLMTVSIWRCVACCLVLLAWGRQSVVADTIKYRNGETESRIWMNGVQISETQGSLLGNRITGGDVGKPIIISLADIEYVEFREPGDTAVNPNGRVGHMTDAGGKSTIFNAYILGGGWKNGTFFFRIRRPGVGPGGATDDVPIARISRMRLGPPAIGSGASAAGPPTIGGTGTGDSYLDDSGGAVEDAPTIVPTDQLPPSRRGGGSGGPQTAEEMLDQLSRNSGTPGQPSSPFLIKPMPQENPFSLSGQGFYVILGAMAALCTLTFVFGTFILLYVAKSEGMKEFTVFRAIIASALLAFVPPSLFAICWLVIPVFIAIKLFAGVLSFYYSARTIVMGFFEVMESKANDILLTFYALLLFIVALGWIYMTWGK